MVKSLDFIDFIHVMHDKLLGDGFIGDLSHHSVDGLAAELVFSGI